MKNKKIAIILILIISITNLFTYVLANNIFLDVKADAWYASYVTSLAEKKIVEGYDDGTFGPTDELNYNQYLKMVVVTITGENLAPKEGEEWDTPYINKAYDLGLIHDKNQD
ncbi:MAG: S-layer homology domain-containing protein, partial [Firmicutes bacterium]|nr:S-layer homology domain-containing protein [Bacillota bacterium]